MKSRPNNFHKNIVRSKSPLLLPSYPPYAHTNHNHHKEPSKNQIEPLRLGSADAKLTISSVTSPTALPNNQQQPPLVQPNPKQPAKHSPKDTPKMEVMAISRTKQGIVTTKQKQDTPAITSKKELKAQTEEQSNLRNKEEGKVRRGKEQEEDTTELSSQQHLSYVTGQYQLDKYDLFSRKKNVKFQDKTEQLQKKESQKRNGSTSSRNSSILKNSSRVLDRSIASSEKSISIQNSFTAVRKCKIGLTNQQDSANDLVRKKYQSIVDQCKGRQAGKEKYIDELFPPVEASLFTTSVHRKRPIQNKQDIVWMRLTQIFPGRTLRVFSKTKPNNSIITLGEKSLAEPYFATGLNAIKQNYELLSFMFTGEQINASGAYLVKIYQQGSWKCMIVDDLIPCVRRRSRSKREDRFIPVFINITTAKDDDEVHLWPFLLEKAYANYYACYENLCWGNVVDFLGQLTGTPYKQLPLSKKQAKQPAEKNIALVGSLLLSNNTVAVGFNEEKAQFYPIKLVKENYASEDPLLAIEDPLNCGQQMVPLSQLASFVSTVYLYCFGEHQHNTNCPVYPPKGVKQRAKKTKEQRSRFTEIPPNDTTSIRTFTLFKKTKCTIDLQQKDIRFYCQCGVTEYLWVRCVLMQREYDGGFRWVSGRYSNEKHIILQENLQAGEYYLVVMVEWRQRNNRQLRVTLHSDCEFLRFERRNWLREERILELACMDLAQRLGKLNQINKSICSYTYLCEETALIIENIINQRTRGSVTIMRSTNGLKSKVQILPINPQFEVDPPKDYDSLDKGVARKLIGQSVELDIQKGESFTVVLRMRGGIDRKFFKAFNFG